MTRQRRGEPTPDGGATRKRGRPRGACNEAELEQRRAALASSRKQLATGERTTTELERGRSRSAAWKTGQDARSSLAAQVAHPCRRDLCPLEFPCDVRRAADAEGQALEVCPVALAASQQLVATIQTAIEKGDPRALSEPVARTLATLFQLAGREAKDLFSEGLVDTYGVYGADGEVIGEKRAVNPRAAGVFELVRILGITAPDQAITPKSQGERKRDDGLGSLSELLQRRAAVAAIGSGTAAGAN